MAYGVRIGKISDIRKVACYCSNTAGGDLYAGRVVGLVYTDTTYSGDGTVTPTKDAAGYRGMGAAIDYAVGTASVVVGVLDWGPPAHKGYWSDGTWADVITRGPVAHALGSGTVEVKVALYPSTGVDGYVDDVTGDGTAPQGFVGYSLEAIADASTATVGIFVNTLFG